MKPTFNFFYEHISTDEHRAKCAIRSYFDGCDIPSKRIGCGTVECIKMYKASLTDMGIVSEWRITFDSKREYHKAKLQSTRVMNIMNRVREYEVIRKTLNTDPLLQKYDVDLTPDPEIDIELLLSGIK